MQQRGKKRRTVTLVVAYFILKKKNTLYEMQCFVFPASSMLMPPLLLGIVQNGELRMKYSYCRASLKTSHSHGEKKHWKGETILVPCRMHILCETSPTPSTVLLKISLFTLEERTDHSNPITAQV
jgi:hypothetical protein